MGLASQRHRTVIRNSKNFPVSGTLSHTKGQRDRKNKAKFMASGSGILPSDFRSIGFLENLSGPRLFEPFPVSFHTEFNLHLLSVFPENNIIVANVTDCGTIHTSAQPDNAVVYHCPSSSGIF